MNKLTLTLLFTVLLLYTTTHAQHLTVGIKGGISIPNLTAGSNSKTPLNTGYSSRIGPAAGIFVENQYSGSFSLQTGIEYAAEGGKKNGLQA